MIPLHPAICEAGNEVRYTPVMPTNHDSEYKLLFSHPEMVRDLLRDWVPD
jgi:hypothetical protein